MRNSALAGCLLPALLLFPLASGAAPLPEDPPAAGQTVADLARFYDHGPFTLTLTGELQPGFLDSRPCLYSEAHYGEYRDGMWSSWSTLAHTDRPLTAQTPKGPLPLRSNQMRLYLKPSYWKVYTASDAAGAPEAIRNDLPDAPGPITVAAYELVVGTTYYGRVDRLSYWLPPASAGRKPERRHSYVLVLSDQPFINGKPSLPMTPVSQTITF